MFTEITLLVGKCQDKGDAFVFGWFNNKRFEEMERKLYDFCAPTHVGNYPDLYDLRWIKAQINTETGDLKLPEAA